jgi:hypothetical protein
LASKKSRVGHTRSVRERAAHRLEQRSGPVQQPRLDHRRRHADVGRAFALAIVDRAHAVADFQADVPHEREEALEIALPQGDLALGQQNHDVDVGAQVELAASVAADCDQRDFATMLADVQAHAVFSSESTSRARSRTSRSTGSSSRNAA